MAAQLENAGFDSIWVADHVVMTREIQSAYPFAKDGRITWSVENPYYDCLIALGIAGSATSRVELGTAILVLPMRNPVVVAKQVATISALSSRRVQLGVGAGWMAEEFEAVGSDFATRGKRLDEAVAVMRACWEGAAPAVEGLYHRLPPGVLSYPVPPEPVQVLVGGMSPYALRRAARNQGWLAEQGHDSLDFEALARGLQTMREAAVADHREPADLRAVFRITGYTASPDMVEKSLARVAAIGFDEIIVDVDWEVANGPEKALARLREASAS